MGLRWAHVDTDRGEVVIRSGRVALAGGGRRTVTEEPKSSASRLTVPVEEIQPGTVPLLRALKARQAADRLMLGVGYPDTGLVVVDALGRPMRPAGYSDCFALLCRDAGVRQVHLHAVRHTLALMGHRAGMAPADMAALLGHGADPFSGVYTAHGEGCSYRR
jgi:integrase